MEFTKERLQIWQTIRHKSFTKDVLQNRIYLCLDEIERLQARVQELEAERDYLDAKCAELEKKGRGK